MENENALVQSKPSMLGTIEEKMNQTYTSIDLQDENGKLLFYNTLQNADFSLSEHLNETIMLKDVILQQYNSVNDETGEIETRTRTILVDKTSQSYGSASAGLYNSLIQLFNVYGLPNNWTEPIPVKVIETKMKNGNKTYVIKVVPRTLEPENVN